MDTYEIFIQKNYGSEYNYNIINNLIKNTDTFLFYKNIPTEHLYYNYDNVFKKSATRIKNIINCIIKNKSGKNYQICKKYQINGYYEYKILNKYCTLNNIKCELLFDNKLLKNKVKNVKQFINDYDHENNLDKIIVEYIKIPIMYIKVY
jgi:hypothetical protein